MFDAFFYGQPTPPVETTEQLEFSMNNFQELNGLNSKHVILGGNFNLPYEYGSRTDAQNYRPVSKMTSVPCEVLEHSMFWHIMTHLDAHNVLVDHQHGFRSNCSCETQLINTTEHLARSINDRNQLTF